MGLHGIHKPRILRYKLIILTRLILVLVTINDKFNF